jgi:hypothetical protein
MIDVLLTFTASRLSRTRLTIFQPSFLRQALAAGTACQLRLMWHTKLRTRSCLWKQGGQKPNWI